MMSFRIWYLLLTLFAFAWPARAFAEDKVFRVVYADYRPYSWLVEGHAVGLEVSIADALLVDRLHLQVEHLVLPWERAQLYVKSGKADAMIATANPERASYASALSVPVTYWQMSAFARHDDARFVHGVEGVASLAPYILGTERGNRWLPVHLPGAQIQFVDNMAQLPKLLVAGRIDLIADDAIVIRELLANMPERNLLVEHAIPASRSPMFFMLSKQSQFAELRDRIDAALGEMEKDGTLTRIQQKYE